MEENVLVIPSLNPNENFLDLLDNFKSKIAENNIKLSIVVVNDGSLKKFDAIFEKIKEKNIVVLKHAVNLGKGRALKTAFNYILNETKNLKSVVTADSDGQHLIEDIIYCLENSNKNLDTLILGKRDFDKNLKSGKDKIPFKSKFGNKMTRWIFNYLLGLDINDTQTGLRAFSKNQVKDFLEVKGERFEYETNMLIDNKNLGYKFKEVPIHTVYIKNNESSHFNPIRDSIAIYSLFFKYIIVAILSFAIDISLFGIFRIFKFTILNATIIARVLSSILNYTLNRNKVFKSFNKKSLLKYYILVIIQMFVSGYSVKFLHKVIINENVIFLKIIIDLIIFVVNYYIQREWVFERREK
ncbi:GtrA family protein [Leptotrichia sp. HSP-536]|uniref:GtrA family protein n=1 Tax=Leptotrichia alba TaxID=3239304 RepID=A0AB39V2X1_9FUSO